jgi:hypothetical protein
MDIQLPENFFNILNKDFKKFKSNLLDMDYDVFKNYNKRELEVLFLYSIVDNTNAMKTIKNKLIKSVMESEINKCFYNILKFKYKQDNGLWSWNEINEWDIPFDEIKKTTTNFNFC